MIILNIAASYPAANGYRILRFADRSGWMAVHPVGRCRPVFATRKAAADWAANSAITAITTTTEATP